MDDGAEIAKQWLKDLPAADVPGFKPEEMIACEKCARKNPPTRAKCFYCAADLNLSEAAAAAAGELAPDLKPMETWEKGYNLILSNASPASFTEENIRSAAQLLRLDIKDVRALLEKQVALPIAKTRLLTEAETVKKRLAENGFSITIWADGDASLDQPNLRLRSVEFDDETVGFVHFMSGESYTVRWDEIALMVTGNLFENKKGSTERYTKKEQDKKITQTSEMSSDEPVIDIYGAAGNIGYRVMTRGFDFSFLGAEKSLLAVENIKRMVELFRRRAANARIDESYLKFRRELNIAWPVEEKLASKKMQREGVSKFNFDQVTVASNEMQFTKYSRLQWQLLKGNQK